MSSPKSGSAFMVNPDATFRLAQPERDMLPPNMNADALEELLAWVHPEHRKEILSFYQQLRHKKINIGPAFGDTGNPSVNAILERLWVHNRPLPEHNRLDQP